MVQHGYDTTNFQIPNRTFRTRTLRLMVVSGVEGRRNGHTCGTWSRSRGVHERCFGCIMGCFWGCHYPLLDL
jgi:hypothetical protein